MIIIESNSEASRVEDYPYVGSRLNGIKCVFTLEEYWRDLKINKLFFKDLLSVLFPLIDLKQNGNVFQMVPAETIKLFLNRLFLGLGKEKIDMTASVQ